jgi:hypothetical protein
MAHRALRLVLVLCAAPLAFGCGAFATIGALIARPIVAVLPDEPPPFEDSVHAFNDDLRWGRVRQAVTQIEREQQIRFLEIFDNEALPYQFTSIDLVSSDAAKFEPKGDGRPVEIDALVSYEFYRPPMVTTQKVRQHQVWRYEVVKNRWVLDFDFTPFEPKAAAPAAPAAVAPVD